MAIHEMSVGASDEWYTPQYVFDALRCRFDVDVSASPNAPWVPAERFIYADSLELPWDGYVWMNPPFGGRNGIVPWLKKFIQHGNGIALAPDRTSAPWWMEYASMVDALLFISPKIKFIPGPDVKVSSPGQGTVLMAMGSRATSALRIAAGERLGVFATPEKIASNRCYRCFLRFVMTATYSAATRRSIKTPFDSSVLAVIASMRSRVSGAMLNP